MTVASAPPAVRDSGSFRWEDAGRDFPFYAGVPVRVTLWHWAAVLAAVAVAFLTLVWSASWPLTGWAWPFLPAVGLAVLPLLALAGVAPGQVSRLFGPVHFREVRLMFGFAALNIVVSMALGATVQAVFHVSANGSTAQLANLDTFGRIAFFAKSAPQLLGEEVITVLPFLALLQLFMQHFGWGRKAAVVGAWVATAVLFGLLHLPTYDWNWVQCLVVIGGARLVLTLPWIMTKNLWVSTGAHIANDWFLFGLGLLAAGVAVKA